MAQVTYLWFRRHRWLEAMQAIANDPNTSKGQRRRAETMIQRFKIWNHRDTIKSMVASLQPKPPRGEVVWLINPRFVKKEPVKLDGA